MKPRAYYEAVATLTGCIIGAGILAIPYVVVRSGFWTGMLVLLTLGFATLLVHLMAGEVSLRTKECHQLVGLTGRYLGPRGKFAMFLSMLIGVYGALIAYTVGVGASLEALTGLPSWAWSVTFYVLMSIVLYGGVRTLARSELWLDGSKLTVLVIILLILFGSRNFDAGRLAGFSWQFVLVPYGVMLFAFLGTAAIPELREEMKVCLRLTKRAIVVSSLIPIVAYGLFAAAVVGVSGAYTSEVASVALGPLVGVAGFVLLNVFAALAMTTSFLALGYALKQTYVRDFGLPNSEAWALVIMIPGVLMVLGVQSFVRTLDVAGAFAGGLAGILVALTHAQAQRKGERKPEYQIVIPRVAYGAIVILFVIGMVYQLLLFI